MAPPIQRMQSVPKFTLLDVKKALNRVEAHTVRTSLRWFPVLGWIYWMVQNHYQSKALAQVRSYYISPGEFDSASTDATYRETVSKMSKCVIEHNLLGQNTLDQTYRSLLKKRVLSTQAGLRKIFGSDWDKNPFRERIFPAYLLLAKKTIPNTPKELLKMQQMLLPDETPVLDLGKLRKLRDLIEENPSQFNNFMNSSRSDYKEIRQCNMYILEIRRALGRVFGEKLMSKTSFRKNLAPLYASLAMAVREGDQHVTKECLQMAVRMLPGTPLKEALLSHEFDPKMIFALRGELVKILGELEKTPAVYEMLCPRIADKTESFHKLLWLGIPEGFYSKETSDVIYTNAYFASQYLAHDFGLPDNRELLSIVMHLTLPHSLVQS